MVDPNRKINHLTDKDIEFLEECEEEFSQRYTEDDDEFVAQCVKPLPPPPIMDNWIASGGGSGGNNSGHYNNRSGGRNWRGNNRGGRSFWKSNQRHQPYHTHHHNHNRQHHNDKGSGVSAVGGIGKDTNSRINIRRDYNNFVAASHD